MRINIFGWHPNHFVLVAVALALVVIISVSARQKEKLSFVPVFPAPIRTGPTVEQIEQHGREQLLASLDRQIRTKEKEIVWSKRVLREGPVHDELVEHHTRRIEALKKRKQALLEPKPGRLIKNGKVAKK